MLLHKSSHKSSGNVANKMFKDILILQSVIVVVGLLGITIDGIVTGSLLSQDCLTAYGLVLPLVTILTAVAIAFSNGISTLTGKNMGSGDLKNLSKEFSGCLEWSILFGIIITIILCTFSRPIALSLKATGDLTEQAAYYMIGYSIGIPGLFLSSNLSPLLQIVGKRKLLLSSMAVTTLVNIGADLLNGLVLHKGLFVMALGTAISIYVGLVMILIGFFCKTNPIKFRMVRLQFAHLLEIVKYGFPGATAMIFRNILTIMLNMLLLNIAGATAVAAFTALISILNLAMSVGTSIGTATSMLTALFMGERDADNMKKTCRAGLKYSVVINAVITCILLAFSRQIISMYTKGDAELLDIGTVGLRITSLCLIFYSINAMLRFYYQASGKYIIAYTYSAINCLVCIAIPAYGLAQVMSTNGIWIAYPLGEVLTIIVIELFIFIRSDAGGSLSDRLLSIPAEMYDQKKNFSAQIHSLSDVISASQKTYEFLKKNGAEEKTANHLALAIEEFGKNIIDYGFADGKKHNAEIKLIKDQDKWVVRIRDDCRNFNLLAYAAEMDESEKYHHIGIKMILGLIQKVNYISTFKMNCTSLIV